MRDNWILNRIFSSYDDILYHCCFPWNKLIDMPWKIMSIGTRDWAYRSRSTRLGITHDLERHIARSAPMQRRPMGHQSGESRECRGAGRSPRSAQKAAN